MLKNAPPSTCDRWWVICICVSYLAIANSHLYAIIFHVFYRENLNSLSIHQGSLLLFQVTLLSMLVPMIKSAKFYLK